MTRLRKALLALALVLPLVALVGAAALALQPLPAVPAAELAQDLSPQDIDRVLRLAQMHDPQRAIPGIVRRLRLSAHEAELLLNHAAARWPRAGAPSRWALAVAPGNARLQTSFRVAIGPWRPWLNFELGLRETTTLPRIDSARVGRLPLPAPALQWLLLSGAPDAASPAAISTLAAATVHQVQMGAGQLSITYAWQPEAASRMLAWLLPAPERARLREYAGALARVTAGLDPTAPVALSQLLPPLFRLAWQRSAAGGDAALENRAALMVLGMAANGIRLSALLPERAAELDRRPIRLLLAGRRDFPQHFLISATIAAENGTRTADTIGLFKELADARHGSGFSFNDIAANRAGTRFGELAVHAPDRLQQRLISGVAERDFMPDVTDLPEFMPEPEFRRRFGGPGSADYERVVADIEQRLDGTPLFR